MIQLYSNISESIVIKWFRNVVLKIYDSEK